LWNINAAEDECQAKKAKEQAQRDQQLTALVLNKEKGRKRTKFHLISAYISQNLNDAILDLH